MMYEKPMELERKHLEDAVAEILVKPLAIITAPSGYGKTTLARSFFQKHPEINDLWLPCGSSEVDEAWVWRQLCELIGVRNRQLCKILSETGLPQTIQETDYFISVVRENIHEPVCIVLDDYHECNGQAFNRLIERLAFEEITYLHIMIISRLHPDIACDEMFLKGYSVMIDQQMLALDREESEQVFRINGIELTEQEAEQMYEYTDGWIAAVYLLLYNYMKIGRFEHLTNIGRLLKNAVFDKLSGPQQELCMKMSLIKGFTLKEACFVMEKDVSFYALTQMMEQFGFIHFDTNTGEYTLHALLRSVAAGELEKRGIDRAGIFKRCGEYREKTGKYVGAILCYKDAGAFDRALELLSGDMRNVIFEQAPGIVRDLFDMVPLDTRLEYPKAYLGYIYYTIIKEDAVRGMKLYREAEERYKEYEEQNAGCRPLKGELLIIEALLGFNDLEVINGRLKEAYELLEHHASGIFENSLLTFGTPFMTVLYYKTSGELQKTIELEKEYARYHMRLMKGAEGSWDEFFEGEYALMKNDIEKAYALSCQVAEKASFGSWMCIVISSYYLRLRCLIQMGREKEFYEVMEEFQEKMKGTVRPVLLTDFELACGYVYACIGRIDKIPEWLRMFRLQDCSRIVRNVRSGCVVYGMMLSRMKKWVLVDAVADEILVPYENTSHTYIIIYGYILKSIAVLHLAGAEKACEYLAKAVVLAEPDELRIPFIEMGADILPMVEALGRSSKFCAALKQSIKHFQNAVKAFDIKPDTATLSKREMELMHYVKAGFRNSEISHAMHIALVTVEKNLTSIYRKLNVSNRAAAVARLEEIRLEEPV